MSKQSRKLFEGLNDVREDLIEEAQEKPEKRKNTGRWLRWAAAAACVCLLAGAAFLLRDQLGFSAARNAEAGAGGSDGRRWPVKIIELSSDGKAEQMAAWGTSWEEMEIYHQYAVILFDGRLYLTNGPLTVPLDRLEGVPQEITASNYEGGLTSENVDEYTPEHQIPALVSRIQGISGERAVAVQYEGTEEWYPALDHDYAPQTLGQFIDDLNLRENLTFGTAYYTYWPDGEHAEVHFDSVDSGKIWELLLSHTEAENACWNLSPGDFYTLFDPGEEPGTILDISVSIPILGEENLALQVREDGYLSTNLMGMTEKAFLIGEENTQAFVDYVLNECEGYEIQYVFPEPLHEEREENDDSSTVSYIATPEGMIPADRFDSESPSAVASTAGSE